MILYRSRYTLYNNGNSGNNTVKLVVHSDYVLMAAQACTVHQYAIHDEYEQALQVHQVNQHRQSLL